MDLLQKNLQNGTVELDAVLDESIDEVFDDSNSTSHLRHEDNESGIASASDSESTIDVPVEPQIWNPSRLKPIIT